MKRQPMSHGGRRRGESTGAKAPRTNVPRAQDSQETGIDTGGDTTFGQNATEGIRHKSYPEVVIEGMRWRARVFVGILYSRSLTES